MKNPQSDFQIFTFSESKDGLTGLFTSQPITVVALSTAPACRPRAPSAGAPRLCPLAPHPPALQQLPLSCQAGSIREPASQLAALPCPTPLTMGRWPPPLTTCPWGSAAPPGAGEMSIVPFQINVLAAVESCAEAQKIHGLTV